MPEAVPGVAGVGVAAVGAGVGAAEPVPGVSAGVERLESAPVLLLDIAARCRWREAVSESVPEAAKATFEPKRRRTKQK